MKPHVLSLTVSSDDELAEDGSLEVGGRDTMDHLRIIGDNALCYPLSDAVILNGPPRRLYLWKLRHCSLRIVRLTGNFLFGLCSALTLHLTAIYIYIGRLQKLSNLTVTFYLLDFLNEDKD